ncbi:MAG: DUF6175 family protein [Ignavibacteria bacterium]|jgi:hypothetical protein
MNIINTITIICLIFCFFTTDIIAQDKQVSQPTVMVVPYVDKANMKGTFEEALQEPSQRLAISIAEKALIDNGLKTLSFQTLLENERKDAAFQAGDGGDDAAKEDIRDILSRKSGADIRVELDLTTTGKASDGSFKVRQIISAIDPFTGQKLAQQDISTDQGLFFQDTAKVAQGLLSKVMRNFIDQMQLSFTDIVNNGRDYIIDVTIDQTSTVTMASTLGGTELGDILYDYFESKAFKANFSEPEKSKTKFKIERFKVALREPDGTPYRISKLERGLKSVLKTNQINADIRTTGGKMYVNIK